MASGPGKLHVLLPGESVFKHLKIVKLFFAHVIQNIQLSCAKEFCTAAIIWSLIKVVRNLRNEIVQVNRCKHASERACLQPCSTGRSYYGKNME